MNYANTSTFKTKYKTSSNPNHKNQTPIEQTPQTQSSKSSKSNSPVPDGLALGTPRGGWAITRRTLVPPGHWNGAVLDGGLELDCRSLFGGHSHQPHDLLLPFRRIPPFLPKNNPNNKHHQRKQTIKP